MRPINFLKQQRNCFSFLKRNNFKCGAKKRMKSARTEKELNKNNGSWTGLRGVVASQAMKRFGWFPNFVDIELLISTWESD